MIKVIPIRIAPTKIYCLRRPHRDRVLSEIKPINGSVMASTTRGKKKMSPHMTGSKPKSCTNTTINTPSAAGNICIASIPKPKKTFVLIGTCVCFGFITSNFSLTYIPFRFREDHLGQSLQKIERFLALQPTHF